MVHKVAVKASYGLEGWGGDVRAKVGAACSRTGKVGLRVHGNRPSSKEVGAAAVGNAGSDVEMELGEEEVVVKVVVATGVGAVKAPGLADLKCRKVFKRVLKGIARLVACK
jgi:hypothetical protein